MVKSTGVCSRIASGHQQRLTGDQHLALQLPERGESSHHSSPTVCDTLWAAPAGSCCGQAAEPHVIISIVRHAGVVQPATSLITRVWPVDGEAESQSVTTRYP